MYLSDPGEPGRMRGPVHKGRIRTCPDRSRNDKSLQGATSGVPQPLEEGEGGGPYGDSAPVQIGNKKTDRSLMSNTQASRRGRQIFRFNSQRSEQPCKKSGEDDQGKNVNKNKAWRNQLRYVRYNGWQGGRKSRRQSDSNFAKFKPNMLVVSP